MNKNVLKKIAIAGLTVTSIFSFTSCKKKDKKETFTYRTSTTVSPSNWNKLTQQDANDDQISEHLESSLFTFDYKYDSNGEIVKDDYTVKYAAATKLEDVTSNYAGNEKYAVPAGATKGYAYKITLREDLKWNDGTEIKAKDFVYSMKEQLNPLFKNYRADSYYNGSTVIHNAKNYVKQGETGWFQATEVLDTYDESKGDTLVFKLGPATSENNDKQDGACASFRKYVGLTNQSAEVAAEAIVSQNQLKDVLTKEQLLALDGKTLTEILADKDLKATYDAVIGWWKTDPDEELYFFITQYEYPELNFDNVGIFNDGEYGLVLVLDKPLILFNEDGKTLSYTAAYNMRDLPLVKEDLYEANKQKPVQGSTLWTSTYNSSASSTASWGPYMLSEFQGGKSYTLVRNDNWFGYNEDCELYKGQYQTDVITCETISEYQTQLLKFQAGELDDISIAASVASDYRNSEQALFTPSSYVGSLQVQSSEEALRNRQTDGINKTILCSEKFRKALSLSIDRSKLVNTCTTSSMPGFGLYNSVHYYDVAHAKTYRDTEAAKKALLDTYGVEYDDKNIDEQYKKITGFDLTQARRLFTEAYEEYKAANKIKDKDVVELVYGSSVDNEVVRKYYDFFEAAFKEAVKTTPLEGKLRLKFDASFGEKWAEQFRGGAYDLANCGWSGAAWDPGYFLLAYLSPDYMYSSAWKTNEENMTFTMPGKYMSDGNDFTLSTTLMEWYNILNGKANAKNLDWSIGSMDAEGRVLLIAALEKAILEKYYSIPMINNYTAEMISYKIEYASRDYNTFMGYGGLRYLTYNYSDSAWKSFVKKQGGTLSYKG